MSASGKTIYRVRQLLAHDVAIIVEVKNGDTNAGKVKETRDSRMVLGGTDTFWLVGGEKKEPKFLVQQHHASVPVFTSGTSTVASKIRASPLFELPKIVDENAGLGKFDAVSFASATQLDVGYSPQDADYERVVASLSKGTLHLPLEASVSAIEVRAGHWLTSGFEHRAGGLYALDQLSLRSVATAKLENRPHTLKLGGGLVLFASPAKWSELRNVDLRSDEEIRQSVEQWLARSKSAIKLSPDTEALQPLELLRLLEDLAVSEDEKADLASVARQLAKRSEFADILREVLGRDPALRERLTAFESEEKARLQSELEERIRRETEAESARLAALRIEVSDAETKLLTLSQRETLLRNETEKHEETLRNRIASAAEAIMSASSRETATIRDEVALLRDDVNQLAAVAAVSPASAKTEQGGEMISAPSKPAIASDDQMKKTFRDLAASTGLRIPDVAAVVATFTEVIPVLLGPGSASSAIDIATAFAGDDAAVVFCDPTKISLADLLHDEQSGLTTTIEKARQWPDMLFVAALCSITSSPCEYWLPQMIEMRRVGRLPQNLALIASAGDDGLRVPIPNSTLRHLFPLKPSNPPRTGSAKFEGLWPTSTLDQERVREAVDVLIERKMEGSAMQTTAKAVARTPYWVTVPEVIDVFIKQAKWLEATAQGSQHEYDEYFTNVEGKEHV